MSNTLNDTGPEIVAAMMDSPLLLKLVSIWSRVYKVKTQDRDIIPLVSQMLGIPRGNAIEIIERAKLLGAVSDDGTVNNAALAFVHSRIKQALNQKSKS